MDYRYKNLKLVELGFYFLAIFTNYLVPAMYLVTDRWFLAGYLHILFWNCFRWGYFGGKPCTTLFNTFEKLLIWSSVVGIILLIKNIRIIWI